MRKRTNLAKKRSWPLVCIGLIMLLFGLTLVVLSLMYRNNLGIWSIFIGLSGAGTVFASSMSIIKNDPSWILLDLLLPA